MYRSVSYDVRRNDDRKIHGMNLSGCDSQNKNCTLIGCSSQARKFAL